MRYNAHGLLYKVKGFLVPQPIPKKGECYPPHEPSELTRRLVVCGKENHMTDRQIAKVLDVCEDTLRKHYRKELDCGKEASLVKITDRLKQCFINNDEMLEKDPKVVQSAIQFYLNAKGGWKQQAETTNTHAVKSEIVHQFDELSLDQLLQAGEGIKRMKGE
jgi:hypothetical protein